MTSTIQGDTTCCDLSYGLACSLHDKECAQTQPLKACPHLN